MIPYIKKYNKAQKSFLLMIFCVSKKGERMAAHTDKQDYSDILHLPHPVSKKHPQMPLSDRAAQFSPFSALTGFEEAIDEATQKNFRRK
jgi:hypothetical protein